LHRLKVTDYRYVGFGSPYYADFILFHKYLYISRMTCLEKNPIKERMQFNKPYKFIDLKMISAYEYIPMIPKSRPVLVWLDYDSSLEINMLEDIDGFIQRSPEKSILMFTVDARAKLPEDEYDPSLSKHEELKKTVDHYNEHYQKYIGKTLVANDLFEPNYPSILAIILKQKILEAMDGRADLSFIQLFNFLYADNAPMLTLGGVLINNKDKDNYIKNNFENINFICQGDSPIKINVPPLTDRERKWIDSNLVGIKSKKKPPFNIDFEIIFDYVKHAKHYPTYHEIVI